MKLSVPFIPDEKYTNFLKNETLNIESVYFSLHSGPVMDSSIKFRKIELHMIENKRLDPDFFSRLTSCTMDCKNCRICNDLFLKTATKKPIKIKKYEEYL